MNRMNRRECLQSMICGAAGLFGGACLLHKGAAWPASAAGKKPNFVFILIDDMGWRDIGCASSTFYETPNIDRLASQGMRFTNAYAACPVCSPTRASIVFGKYPQRTGVTNFIPGSRAGRNSKLVEPPNTMQVALEEVAIAEALKPAGYVSASIGKWHMGGKEYYPDKQGFDISFVTGGSHWKWNVNPPYKPEPGEYLADRLTDEGEKFIEENKDKPFLLYLAHFAVHIPLEAKKEILAKYEAKPKPAEGQNNAIYAAMIESVDQSVARIMRKIEELKIADRTVIFFMSDNGGLSVKEGPNTPSTTNAPLRAGKGYLYEGGVREPMIVRWPGAVKPGSVCNVPVISVDFYPTMLEMARVKPPRKHHLDGISLVPLLKQSGSIKRDAIFWHYPHYGNQGGKPGGAVRQGDYKLIEFYEDGHLELYNLKDDVSETNNLADKMPEKAAELRRLLDAWRKDVGAKIPTPNSKYDPSKPDEWGRPPATAQKR